MELISGKTELACGMKSAVALGKFDGFHKGHQKLIGELLGRSEDGIRSVIFTFSTPPGDIIYGRKQMRLLTAREKREHAARLGVDTLVEYPFTQEVCHTEAADFVRDVLVGGLGVRAVITGSDFCFGYQRRGNVQLLKELAPVYGYEVSVISKEQDESGMEISSTYIRDELRQGNIEHVNSMLGYLFYIRGDASNMSRAGMRLGMPVISLTPAADKLLPPDGVYISLTNIDGRGYGGVTNVISQGSRRVVETYLQGVEKAVTGRELNIQLLHYQRPEICFDNTDQFRGQLMLDAAAAKEYIDQSL